MPSASEAPGNDDNASGYPSRVEMDNDTASGASGVHRGSGGSVTTHRAKIVPGDKVELLSKDPRTMSVPNDFHKKCDQSETSSPYQTTMAALNLMDVSFIFNLNL